MNAQAAEYVPSKVRRQPPPPPQPAPSALPPPPAQGTFHVNPMAPMPALPPQHLLPTKLRAVAKPFEPKASPTSSGAPTMPMPVGPAAPPPPPPPPEYNSPNKMPRPAAPLDYMDPTRLNVGAAPYTPTKSRVSPTSAGTPTGFPDAPAPPMPVAANLQPANFVGIEKSYTPSGSSTASPMSPPATPAVVLEPFAKSALQVPPGVRPAPSEAIKFNVVWTLWADDHPLPAPGESKPSYQEPVIIRDVGDLETFWRLWWHMPPPSACAPSWTYNWFRKDVKPAWEEPRNKNGGTITFVLYDNDKCAGLMREVMDDAFMLMVMGLAGEAMAESSVVNGVCLKIRAYRPVVLQVWTNCSDEAKLRGLATGIRSLMSRVLPAKQTEKLEFFSHARMHQHTQAVSAAATGRFSKVKAVKPLDADFTF